MTIRQACLQLSCAPRTLHALLAANGLPSTRGSHTQSGVLSVQAEQIVNRLAQVPLPVVQTPAPTLHEPSQDLTAEIDRLRQESAWQTSEINRLSRCVAESHEMNGELLKAIRDLREARRPFWSGWRAWWQRSVVVEEWRRPEFAPTEIYYAERMRA